MAESVMKEPTASEADQLLAEIKQAFAEMDRLREQMRRDDLEIENPDAGKRPPGADLLFILVGWAGSDQCRSQLLDPFRRAI